MVMESNPRKRKIALLATFGLILLAVILALIAPEEKTLGGNIRLIYLHAAITWVGLIMFVASGLLGLLYFIGFLAPGKSAIQSIKDTLVTWSSAGQSTATIFWVGHLTLGAIGAYVIWGGTWWHEPRLRVATLILLMAVVTVLVRSMVENKSLWAALNFGLPALAFLLLLKTGKIFHPNNAFAASDSFAIKFFAGLITLVFIVAALALMSVFTSMLREQEAKA